MKVMTTEEAIVIIEWALSLAETIYWDKYSWALGEKEKEALRIALKVLGDKK